MIYISDEPKLSPWGAVQHCKIMNTGIYSVDTAGHGGIMIKTEYAKEILSPEARRCGFRENGYLNFEEDCAAAVAEREFLDKGIWKIPDYVKDKTEYENNLNNSIKRYFPEYWEKREKKLSANYSKNSEKKSLLQTLKENKTKVKQLENINKSVKEKNNMR